jgi:hypothetical protein
MDKADIYEVPPEVGWYPTSEMHSIHACFLIELKSLWIRIKVYHDLGN